MNHHGHYNIYTIDLMTLLYLINIFVQMTNDNQLKPHPVISHELVYYPIEPNFNGV